MTILLIGGDQVRGPTYIHLQAVPHILATEPLGKRGPTPYCPELDTTLLHT